MHSRPLSVLLASVVGATMLGSLSAAAAPGGAAAAAAVPAISTSHYVRTTTGPLADPTDQGEGCADARAGSNFVLLDIGAQLNDGTGVELSATATKVGYANLRAVIDAYAASFATCSGGRGAVIAVSTNNDGDFKALSASARGAAWADHVIDRLAHHTGLNIVGADDIESGFRSSEAQAEAWETAYLKATTGVLIFNGDAANCPKTVGVIKHSCGPVRDGNGVLKTWTQAQYYRLAHAVNATRIRALPQIYLSGQATQWANIDATGTKNIPFSGALTEHATCVDPTLHCQSFTPTQGWTALRTGLARIGVTPRTVATDLRVN